MNNKRLINKILAVIMIMAIVLTGCTSDATKPVNQPEKPVETANNQEIDDNIIDDNQATSNNETQNDEQSTNVIAGETLDVHFIDVGQGDAILIKQGEQSLLIDAGDNKYGPTVVSYLHSQGIKKLDYVIGTHPHADHIGGLDDVINEFKVDNVILPNKIHTTKTFEDVLKAIDNQGLKITTPKVGDVYQVGQAKFTILAPNSPDYKNLNDFSVATKVEYGNQSFFFSGDSEALSENEIVNNGQNIKSTVMKAGHHGSNTSNTDALLNKVDPEFVVIQVGEGNKYNHPNEDILQKFISRGITVYRNDLHGNIIVTTDGENLDFSTEKGSANNVAVKPIKEKVEEKIENVKVEEKVEVAKKEETTTGKVIGTKTTKKVHTPDCRYVPKKENQVEFASIQDAHEAGFESCKVCNP